MGRGSEQTCFKRRHTDGQQAHEKMLNITNYQGNANQNHRYHLILLEGLLSKRQGGTDVAEDMEKREPSRAVGKNVNWCSHYGKQYGDFSKN